MKYVDEAYEIGAKSLAFLSGKDPGEGERDQAFKLLISSINEICEYAKSKGDLRIALEIFDREIDKKCLIGPANEAKMVAEEVRKEFDNFGLMVDLSHLPLLKETPGSNWSKITQYFSFRLFYGQNPPIAKKNYPIFFVSAFLWSKSTNCQILK